MGRAHPAETFLGRIQQAVYFGDPVEAICNDSGQQLIHRILQAYRPVIVRVSIVSLLVEKPD
jgi:hypothetical protein